MKYEMDFMNIELTILSPQILSDVFAWSPTQRRKLDKHLSVRCRNFWPKGPKDEFTFYKVFMDAVDGEYGKRVFSFGSIG